MRWLRFVLLAGSLALAVGCGGGGNGGGPDLTFEATPTSGDAPLQVTFEWLVTNLESETVAVTLDYGDGSALLQSDQATGTVSHTYTQPGSYDAMLTADYSTSDTDQKSVEIRVGQGAEPAMALTNAEGDEVDEVSETSRATLLASMTGLPPGQPVEVMLYRDGQPVYRDAGGALRPVLVTVDQQGTVPFTVLAYDLGIDPETGVPIPAVGNYQARAVGSGVDLLIPLTVTGASKRRQAGAPDLWTMIAGGRFARGSVLEGAAVYANGAGFPANRRVRLYVVPDRRDWQSGDTLEDVTGLIEEVTTTAEGDFADRVQVWASAQVVAGGRDFDLVADVADAGGSFDSRFTPDQDALDAGLVTGFTVQGPPEQASRRRQAGGRVNLACDAGGRYQSAFSAADSVHLWVNPPRRPLTPSAMAKKYVCLHQDRWTLGDELVDVTGRPEWDLVRYTCSNEYVATVWAPPLQPGVYDPVIDVNQNDVYDAGDILGNPFQVEGQRPKRVLVSARWPILNPGQDTPITAAVIDQNDRRVAGVAVTFELLTGGGTLAPASGTTDAQGKTTTVLQTGSTPGVTLRVRATVEVEGDTVRGQADVLVRALGGLQGIVQ